MKARREQVDEELMVIKLFASNYARDLLYLRLQNGDSIDIAKSIMIPLLIKSNIRNSCYK